MNLNLRIPGQTAQHRFEFMDDTGCDIMTIYESDLEVLRNLTDPRAPRPQTMGLIQVRVGSGDLLAHRVIGLCVNICTDGQNPQEMVQWDWVQCALRKGTAEDGDVPRLAGPWLRCKLFTATAPDGSRRMWAHTRRSHALTLPKINLRTNPPDRPPWLRLDDDLTHKPIMELPEGMLPADMS